MLPTITTSAPVKTISWDKDSSSFAYAEENRIIVRSAADFSLLQSIETSNGNILFLAFTQSTEGEGQNQLAALSEKDILEYRVLPQREPVHVTDQKYQSEPTVLAYSYNGNYIATGNQSGRIQLYLQNYVTHSFVARTIGSLTTPIHSLYFSRDNKYLISSTEDYKAHIWDVASGELVKELPYYSPSKTPVYISHNSQYIISVTEKDKIIIYDMSFNPLRTIETIFPIESLRLTADGARLIVLTKDNIFRLYDIFTAQLLNFIPAFNGTPITSFAFNNTTTKMVICHEDGSMYVMNVDNEMMEYTHKASLEDTEEEIPVEDKLYDDGHGAYATLGVCSVPYPFTIAFMLDTGYLNYEVVRPFYFGAMMKPYFALAKTYPVTFYDAENEILPNPYLVGIKIYSPAGFLIHPFQDAWEFFAELQTGFSLNMIWNGQFGEQGMSTPLTPSFYAGAKIGASWKAITAAVTCEYDVIYGFTISGGIGVSINIGGKNSKKNNKAKTEKDSVTTESEAT